MKRLYEMGGDITSQFYTNSESSVLKPGKKKKVKSGSGKPYKKNQFSGCKKGQCVG